MTTTSPIINGDCIWPESESDDDYEYDHAIVVQRYSNSISIKQRDSEIIVPEYALDALIRSLRKQQRILRGGSDAE